MEGAEQLGPGVVGVEGDVFSGGGGGPDTPDGAGVDAVVFNEILEDTLGVVEEFGGFFAVGLMLQDFGEDAAQFPGVEEGRPVEDFGDLGEGDGIPEVGSDGFRRGDVGGGPVDGEFLLFGLLVGDVDGAGAFAGVEVAVGLLADGVLGEETFAQVLGEERIARADDEGGVDDVDDGLREMLADLDGGVGPRGGGASDEERSLDAALFELLRIEDHLVERGRDEPAQSDDVGLVFGGGGEDAVAVDHDAEVDDLVAIAA